MLFVDEEYYMDFEWKWSVNSLDDLFVEVNVSLEIYVKVLIDIIDRYNITSRYLRRNECSII